MSLETINGLQKRDTATTTGAGGIVLNDNFGRISNYYHIDNLLCNGNFRLAERQATPSTLTNYADRAFSADRWIQLQQLDNVQYARNSGTVGSITLPTGSTYWAQLKQTNASTNKWGFLQQLPNHMTAPLQGAQVRFQCQVASTDTNSVRLAIVQWTGTADAMTRDIVNDWTSTTYTTGNFFTSTTLSVTVSSATVLTANTWTNVSLEAAVGSTTTNIAVFIWNSTGSAQNTSLGIAQAMLTRAYVTTTASSMLPFKENSQDLDLCRRYFQKSNDIDAHPSNGTVAGAVKTQVGYVLDDLSIITRVEFKPRMHTTPTVTIYPIGTPSNTGQVSNGAGTDFGIATTGAALNTGSNSFACYNNSGYALLPSDGKILFNWIAEAEIGV